MIEKDNIQDLFSKAFENHASPVRPDLWAGVQAKMSAAGVAGGSAAVKGLSALTKWIVGTAAVTTIGVTTYMVTNTDNKPETKQPAPIVTTVDPASETPIQNQDNGQTMTLPQESNTEQKQNTALTVERPKSNDLAVQLFPNDNTVKLVEKSPVIVPPSKTVPVTVHNNGAVSNPNNAASTSSPNENKSGGTVTSSPTVSNSAGGSSTAANNNASESENQRVAEAKVELPNIFTPNGDGKNDYCEFVKIENVKSIQITIVDQNNNPIIKSDELNFKWDGTLPNGDQAKIGIYTILVIYTDMADKMNTIAKPVYLQR